MTRFSLGIPTAAVLIGLSMSASAQTLPQTAAPTENSTPVETVPAPVTPAAPAPAVPVQTAPVQPTPVQPAPAAPAQAQGMAAPDAAAPNAVTPAIPAQGPTAGAPGAAEPAASAAPAQSGSAEGAAPAPSAAASQADLPAQPVTLAEPARPVLPSAHDMSPVGMYHQADLVVKTVMILLAVASFLSWTVLFYKIVETAVARGRARRAARVLTRSASLASALKELEGRRDPAAFMVQAVAEEYRRSDTAIAPAGAEGVKERAASLVNRVEVQASARLRRGMGLLATIGSVAPFVGLFGTVWGIMNSFIGIAETQTTNLAVVAPGIAEALFATAIGLVAAIPAVVIYNHFTRVIQGYKQTLGDAGAATLRLLSRDIDFRHLEG